MCGEHSRKHIPRSIELGSSPHVRGTPLIRAMMAPHYGIIPACAGNTIDSFEIVNLDRDHPRMCGEHSTTEQELQELQGSSPHVRGTHTCRQCL